MPCTGGIPFSKGKPPRGVDGRLDEWKWVTEKIEKKGSDY
jgi:hypothetical protein